MEEDENDILFTNTFIKAPETSVKSRISSIGSQEYAKEFQDYYIETNKEKELENNLNLKSGNNRYKRLVNTYISIDSRNRDTILYPKPSNFKIFLGKTFYNVRTVKLVTMEFPNTNAVINSTNNKVYWVNQEDIKVDKIDNATKTYPVYNTELRIGSYIASKLETELESKFRQVKRLNKDGDSHYFACTLDIETDVVTFVSLIVKQLGVNPLSTNIGSGLIVVTAQDHGYTTGETIYMIGSRVVSGISSEFINTAHVITVINANTFSYEITEKAITADDGGGSNIKSGRLAPFKLLFGDYQNTVAKNIGYLYENSSSEIVIDIKAMNNFYQVVIELSEKHNLTTSSINSTTVIIALAGTTPSINGTRVVSGISEYKLLINFNSELSIPSFNQGTVDISGTIYEIISVSNNPVKTVILETFNNHNYEMKDIGKDIFLYSTISSPSFDGANTISLVWSATELIITGELLPAGVVNTITPGQAGYTPLHEPITTEYYTVSSASPGVITTFTVPTPHVLKSGDLVKLYNIVTSPSLLKEDSIYKVFTVIDQYRFTINETTTSILSDFSLGESNIGSDIVTCNFPRHGFNTIISITNNIPGTSIRIRTLLPHGYTTGDTMRISQSNSTPRIDNGNYIVTVESSDTFTIPLLFSLTVAGTYGVIGMNMNFRLYRVENISNLGKEFLNNIDFVVRDIVDENNFRFKTGIYSDKKTIGGGSGIFISSLLHGFNGVQTNTKNDIIDRSISLEGENYSFLTSPQLGSMKNTGDVDNIFARITLDQSPGMMVFNFLSNPKEFDTSPLSKLEELEFSMVNFDNTYYEFNDLDYSMTLEIVETIDTDYSFNQSSRRGISDTLN